MRELLKAPWSNQPVRRSVQVLAWLFVACSVLAVGIVGYFTFTEGLPVGLPFGAYALFAGTIYMVALFLFVAIKGKAPNGWLPWEGAKGKQHET